MVFSEEDKILITNLYVYKGYFARQLIGDFPEKGWKLRSLKHLLKKLSTMHAPPLSSFVVRRRTLSLPTCGLPTAQILILWNTESGQCYRNGSINSDCDFSVLLQCVSFKRS